MREITDALRTQCAHTITPGGKKMTNSTEALYLPASKYKSASHASIYFHTDTVCAVWPPRKEIETTKFVLFFIFCKKLMSVVELPFFSILYLQMGALFKCNHAAVSVPLHCDCLWQEMGVGVILGQEPSKRKRMRKVKMVTYSIITRVCISGIWILDAQGKRQTSDAKIR